MAGELFAAGPGALTLILNLWIVGGCLGLVFALVNRIGDGGSPRFRYGLAVATFLAAIVLPLVPRSEPAFVAPLAGHSPEAPVAELPTMALRDLVRSAEDWGVTAFLPLVWLGLAVGLLAREAAGHRALARQRERWHEAPAELRRALGWPHTVPLLIGKDGPSTVGVVQPCVVLPLSWLATLPAPTLRCVAAHELDHARWRDPMVHAGVRILRALLWPSFPLWWLARSIRVQRELAADAAAVGGVTDRGQRAAYARAILLAAGRPQSPTVNPLGFGGGLGHRLETLFRSPRPVPSGRRLLGGALFAGACATALLPYAPTPSPTPMPLPLTEFAAADRRAAQALNAVLLTTEYRDHQLTKTAAESLRWLAASGSVEPVRRALGHPDARTRESAAWVAGVLGDRRLRPDLEAARGDTNRHVRATATWAVGNLARPPG